MSDGIMLTAGMDFSNGEDCTMLTMIVDGKPDHVSCDTPWGRAVVDLLSERDKSADELARLRAEVERLQAQSYRLERWLRSNMQKKTANLARAVRAEAALSDERAHADAMEGALIQIDGHCQNEGYGNPIVDNRIVDRCEETAREALAHHRARRQG